jgi:hypothetical protein
VAHSRAEAVQADDLLSSAFTGDVERRLEILPGGAREREHDHSAAPYLEALRGYAARDPGRYVGLLGSLYPVVTVLLARIVLRERLDHVQRAGATGALAGAVLLAAT